MKKTLMVILMCIATLALTSCGSFFGEDEEAVLIKSISYDYLKEERTTRVTVIYSSPEDKKPDTFYIPDGIDGVQGDQGPVGETGNGIEKIEHKYDENGFTTRIIIYYTDKTLEPTIFDVPNGRSVSGVRSETDRATGNTLVYLQYSDGKESDAIIIRKGVDGNSIIGYNQVVNEDLSVTLTFQCSQSDDIVINIPAPQKGDPGVGIDSMISLETATEYVIQVKFTDGTEQSLSFNKPNEPATWISGINEPRNSEGKIGDYYYDTINNTIYHKTSDGWIEVIDLSSSKEMFTVKFDLNDNDGGPSAYMPQSSYSSYKLVYGQCFGTSAYKVVPIPTRAGYTFLGWYLTPVVSPVNGTFTDMTCVFSDMTLYACWEKNE